MAYAAFLTVNTEVPETFWGLHLGCDRTLGDFQERSAPVRSSLERRRKTQLTELRFSWRLSQREKSAGHFVC